jgi:acid phosphatase
VTWATSAGTISSSGVLTAPASAGTVTVTARSVADSSRAGQATLLVEANPSSVSAVSVTCSPSTIAAGATSQCKANVQGTGSYSSAVNWHVSAGTVTANGLVTAPGSAGTLTVTAASVQDSSRTGSAAITVQAQAPASAVTAVAVTCSPVTVAPGGTSQCKANVQGTGSYSSAVNWAVSAGTVTAGGMLTAPKSTGRVTVTATSTQNTAISARTTVTVQTAQVQPPHVVLVVEENQSYSTVVGNPNWMALNDLIRNGALATNYYANTHPSIGNYFMLTTGQILTNNDNSTQVWNVDNLARRMLASGVSFRIYAEGITQGYVGGNTGLYVVRHNPFALLSDLADNPQAANAHIFPFSQFAQDLASGNLPEFSWVVPNLDDDAHNGTPAQADAWLLRQVINPLSNDAAFQPGGTGVLAVGFDEAVDTDTAYGGGHVAAVFWGPKAKSGYRQSSSTIYQHPSMLREIMHLLGLTNPPGSAAAAPSMDEFFVP